MDAENTVAAFGGMEFLPVPATVGVGLPVDFDRLSGADGVRERVAEGVGNRDVDVQYAVAAVCGAEILPVPAAVGVGLAV